MVTFDALLAFVKVIQQSTTVYPKKYAHGFVVLCFVVVVQSFILNWHEVFIHIHQGCFAGTGAIVRLPQCQWSKPDGYGKISQCITTTKHSKAKTVCIFFGIYCMNAHNGSLVRNVGTFVVVSLNKLLNNHLRWIKIPWRPCDATVKPYKDPIISDGHSVHKTRGNTLDKNLR